MYDVQAQPFHFPTISTAEFNRRRFDQHRRVSQLRQATKHMTPPSEVGDDRWAQVKWYYREYGDFHGGGAALSLALRHKHDTHSDSFLEFIFPKLFLLIIGVISSVTAAVYRFPVSEMTVMSPATAAYLNPDRFGHDSKVYVLSSVVQFIVIEIWCVFIIYTSFVTGERLRREPFLSTRPAQLSFRVLSGILLLGVGFSFTLFSISTMKLDRWAQVKWYYREYGDFHGGGAALSLALRHKHDTHSDSFLEFIFPKLFLLIIGVISSVTAAVYRFPVSEMTVMSPATAAYLNPDRFGHDSKVYVLSSVVQFIVIEIWCVFIIYTSFVTGERLRREPFLSTRPAQLSFRVLSGILLLGVGFSFTLFSISTMKLLHNRGDSYLSDVGIVYDTSLTGTGESWDSRADFLFRMLRLATSQSPYVGSASNIGPGKILYATVCSLVAAFIFLPSSHFRASNNEKQSTEESSELPGNSSKQIMLATKDRRLQGRDKRFVVALARNSHTWRVFPLPIRSHSLMSQHTLKEQLNIVGTFQLDANFNAHRFKFGRGAIYKGRYMPVFCIELACWLLEASWQTYYSSTEYSYDEWAPGKMNLEPMGLKVDHCIDDNESDTHAFVASNISEQVEGEEDSIRDCRGETNDLLWHLLETPTLGEYSPYLSGVTV